MKIKPKQFQRNMKGDKKAEFIEFISANFIDIDNIGKIKKLLTYNKQDNPEGLPSFVSYTLADKAPEVMFMLLYRLLIKKDKIKPELKRNVLGMTTLFTWLGKGEKQKDHGKLLNNIWPCVKHLDTERFWSNETTQRAMLENNGYEILTPLPSLKKLKKLIPTHKAYISNLTSAKIYSSDYGNFIKKMFFNNDVILYAQRAHLSKWFHEIEEYNLDDTNRAFDWDHICPQSYIYKKHNVKRALKDWYNSNGNLRAWPYSLNKSDQDLAPSIKLNPEFEEDEEDINWWKEYLNKPKLTEDSLKDYLLEASFCEEEWLDLNKDDLKNKINNIAKQVINCILQRNYQICEEWYNKLEIDDLIPESLRKKDIKELFANVINNNMWEKEKEEEGWQTYNLSIRGNNLKLYFQYYTEGDTLEEDGIEFGIYNENESEDEDEVVGNIKISKELKDKFVLYKDETRNYIYTNFTLISYSENSIIDLFKSFNDWLKKFPDNNIKKMATKRFHDSIRVQYKKEILNKN